LRGGRTRQAHRFARSDSRPIRVAQRRGCMLSMSVLCRLLRCLAPGASSPQPWTSRTRPRHDVRPPQSTGVTWADRRAAAAADSESPLSPPRPRIVHRTRSTTPTLCRCSRCCLGRRPPLRARTGAAYWVAVCSCIRCAASAAVRRVVAKKGNRRRIRRRVLTTQATACQRPATASTPAAPA